MGSADAQGFAIVGLSFLVMLVWYLTYWPDLMANHKVKQIEKWKARNEYEQYATAPNIDKFWFYESANQPCKTCHQDDAPLVIGGECKWCVELHNIKYHLRHNGTRRFRKKVS